MILCEYMGLVVLILHFYTLRVDHGAGMLWMTGSSMKVYLLFWI